MEYLVAVNSQGPCYVISISNPLTAVSFEVFGTCILHNFAYIVYCSVKLRTIEQEDKKRWAKYYTIYYFTTIALVMLCIIGYGIARGNINGTILPIGHCIYNSKQTHNTLRIAIAVSGINKIIQLVLFITYLYYTYQLNKDISNPAILECQQSLFHKIGLAMGAVVGLSHIMIAIASTFKVDMLVFGLLVSGLTMVQQCTIIAIFLCSKKMCCKYEKCLSRDCNNELLHIIDV